MSSSATRRPVSRPPALAPGARVVIRDEEWLVRTIRTPSLGGREIAVVGLSELVRGKESVFLTELDDLRVLTPESTELVDDDTPRYRRSRLYLESLLRQSPPTDDGVYLGHRGAVRPARYQLQPAAKALRQPRPRLLLADGVGLGKTIEVGVLLTELIERGRGDRILVVALRSVLQQFQEELWSRFTIPLVRLDSVGIQRVQARIPGNQNPFYHHDRVIISIDTLKRDSKYRRWLEDCHWDVIAIDECQHVAMRSRSRWGGGSQRARLAKLLSSTCDALLLTSATPHDGRPESFASLIQLLEPTALADVEHYTADEVSGYFLRRFKKDVAHEAGEEFRERRQDVRHVEACPAEDAVFEALSKAELRTVSRHRGGHGMLFRTLLLKGFLSSPDACAATIAERLKARAVQADSEDARHDRELLEELARLVADVKSERFAKYAALRDLLRTLGVPSSRERVVVFSERLPTLRFLEERLKKDLKLGKDQVATFHGTLDDLSQQQLVKTFGTAESPLRVLLCSDAASEGVNLHHRCHRLVHFDLPWSLITLEQRNGRIDRFGQTETPVLTYLLTLPGDRHLQGDLRVLDRLIEKEQAAHENLGDVAWLMGLHDPEAEEDRVARGIEEHEAAESVIPDEAAHVDFMDVLFGEGQPKEPEPRTPSRTRLYGGDELAYARDAFEEVLGGEADKAVEWHDHLRGFTLHPPDDLLVRYDYLPPELTRDRPAFKLTVDRAAVMKALDDARQEEEGWPEWELFWEQHPVAEWLDDRVLGRFARHEAPVLRVPDGVGPHERVVVFQGVVSNLRSRPVLVDWFGAHFRGDTFTGFSELEHLLVDTGLAEAPANPGRPLTPKALAELGALLPAAVARAKERMLDMRKRRMASLAEELRGQLQAVKRWHDRKVLALDERQRHLEAGGAWHGLARKNVEREREHVVRLQAEREAWIHEGQRTVPEPYLRVACVLIPAGG